MVVISTHLTERSHEHCPSGLLLQRSTLYKVEHMHMYHLAEQAGRWTLIG